MTGFVNSTTVTKAKQQTVNQLNKLAINTFKSIPYKQHIRFWKEGTTTKWKWKKVTQKYGNNSYYYGNYIKQISEWVKKDEQQYNETQFDTRPQMKNDLNAMIVNDNKNLAT